MRTNLFPNLFPAYLTWPPAVGDIGLVRTDATTLRLVSQAKALEKLAQLSSLERLWCFDINERYIKYILRCASLKMLFIDNYRVANLCCLKELRHLETLGLDTCSKIDSLEELVPFPTLTSLQITHFRNVHDLEPLSRLTNLKHLAVSGSMWTAMRIKTLQPLALLTSLEYLCLSNLRADNSSLRPLGELTQLKRLDIGNRFPLEEIAWLAGRLKNTECSWFAPYVDLGMSPCKKCGNKTQVILSGKGISRLCKICDSDRLAKHVAQFNKIAFG